jgi:hypothetical protein
VLQTVIPFSLPVGRESTLLVFLLRTLQIKSLGVALNQELAFDQHVSNIAKSSNFNIRALRHIKFYHIKPVVRELHWLPVAQRV